MYFFLALFFNKSCTQITGVIFGFLLLGAVFSDVISDYLWARAVVSLDVILYIYRPNETVFI